MAQSCEATDDQERVLNAIAIHVFHWNESLRAPQERLRPPSPRPTCKMGRPAASKGNWDQKYTKSKGDNFRIITTKATSTMLCASVLCSVKKDFYVTPNTLCAPGGCPVIEPAGLTGGHMHPKTVLVAAPDVPSCLSNGCAYGETSFLLDNMLCPPANSHQMRLGPQNLADSQHSVVQTRTAFREK